MLSTCRLRPWQWKRPFDRLKRSYPILRYLLHFKVFMTSVCSILDFFIHLEILGCVMTWIIILLEFSENRPRANIWKTGNLTGVRLPPNKRPGRKFGRVANPQWQHFYVWFACFNDWRLIVDKDFKCFS